MQTTTSEKELAAQTANPKAKTTKPKFTDNSTQNQCLKILDWLFERGSITTAQAREHLDVMSPAARIMQLKQAGYLIFTVWDDWTSEHGIKHRIARYILTQKEPVESDQNSEAAA